MYIYISEHWGRKYLSLRVDRTDEHLCRFDGGGRRHCADWFINVTFQPSPHWRERDKLVNYNCSCHSRLKANHTQARPPLYIHFSATALNHPSQLAMWWKISWFIFRMRALFLQADQWKSCCKDQFAAALSWNQCDIHMHTINLLAMALVKMRSWMHLISSRLHTHISLGWHWKIVHSDHQNSSHQIKSCN